MSTLQVGPHAEHLQNILHRAECLFIFSAREHITWPFCHICEPDSESASALVLNWRAETLTEPIESSVECASLS